MARLNACIATASCLHVLGDVWKGKNNQGVAAVVFVDTEQVQGLI